VLLRNILWRHPPSPPRGGKRGGNLPATTGQSRYISFTTSSISGCTCLTLSAAYVHYPVSEAPNIYSKAICRGRCGDPATCISAEQLTDIRTSRTSILMYNGPCSYQVISNFGCIWGSSKRVSPAPIKPHTQNAGFGQGYGDYQMRRTWPLIWQ